MAATSIKQTRATAAQVRTQHIKLKDVSVRYTLLTEDRKTLKGRVLNLFNGAPPSAHFWALRNVGLQIQPGEIVGVVGRNGCGKSTLLRVISGVLDPTEGTVSVDGRLLPILELGAAFSPELTGRENVYLNCSILRIARAQVDEMIPQILAFSELGMFFDIPLKTYSSGMSARLAFSLSTQIQPEIVILDEILGVGDESFQKKSFFRIRKLIESGVIVVIVSHSSSMIEQLCNRVVYLSKGEVVADGTPRQVLSQYQRDLSSGL